jgi:hypothetical protein
LNPLIKNQKIKIEKKPPAGNCLWGERPDNYVPFIPTRLDFYLPFPLLRMARIELIIRRSRTISAIGPSRSATDSFIERNQKRVGSKIMEKSGGNEQPTPQVPTITKSTIIPSFFPYN